MGHAEANPVPQVQSYTKTYYPHRIVENEGQCAARVAESVESVHQRRIKSVFGGGNTDLMR